MKSLIVKLPAFIVCLVCAFSALETRAGVIISAQDANGCAYDASFVADASYSCLYAERKGSARFLNDQSGLTVNYESGVTDFEFVTDFALHSFEERDEGVLYCGRRWCNQVAVDLCAGYGCSGGYSWLTFDLGEIELITRMALWNGREFPGIDGITIFADDDMDYLNGNAGSLGDFAGDPNAGDTAQIFDILDVSSRYFHLKWERVGNSISPLGSDFVEWGQAWIGEVAFEATRDPVVRSVPAPATTALLAVGLLGAAFARSRRTR
jgi:hypothetical protein